MIATKIETYSSPYINLDLYYYISWYDQNIGKLTEGWHVIKVVVDAENLVEEEDEGNNEYSISLYVGRSEISPPKPTPTHSVKSVKLNKASLTISKGKTFKLTSTITP